MFWLAADAAVSMVEEADYAGPDETGGVLLGYLADQCSSPVASHSIGPGPRAVHEPTRFVPDHDFQVAEIARLYEVSNGRLQYLGDWHTHPGNYPALSSMDKATLKRISRYKEARIEQPVMLILGYGPIWLPAAWMVRRPVSVFRRRRFSVGELEVHVYK